MIKYLLNATKDNPYSPDGTFNLTCLFDKCISNSVNSALVSRLKAFLSYQSFKFITCLAMVKFKFGYLIFVTLAIWILLAQCTAFGAGIRDRVVAFVDTRAITLSELEMKLSESRKVKADITKEEVLNTMINRVLLLREAKKIRLEAPSEEELIKEYIDMKIRALIRVKEEEIRDFYDKHIDNFEGKELEDVRDNIENYLIEHNLNERLKSHINELKEKTCVRIQLNPE